MRILVLTTSYPLFAESVSGIFISRLLENMPDDVQCRVITPYDPDSDGAIPAKKNICITAFHYAPKFLSRLAHRPGGIPVALKQNRLLYLVVPFFLLSMLLVTLKHARNVDVIHANWAISGLIAGFAGWLMGTPVVTTLRGSDVPQAGVKSFTRWILSKSLALSSWVISVSEGFERKMKMEFPHFSHKIITIENGVGDDFLSIASVRSLPAIESTKITNLLAIGSLIPRKGMLDILQAFSQLINEPACFLQIVGEGPLRMSLEQKAEELGISDRVKFLGAVEASGIPALLKQADLFILASHWEGRPNVVLEAMATGLAVIATDIDGVKELVVNGRTGLLFEDGDIDALKNCMEQLLRDPVQAYKYGQAGFSRIIEKKLRWCNTAQRYVELYQACIAAAVVGKH